MVPMVKVADIHGKKRVFILGVTLILVACVLVVLSPAFWFLIAYKVMMGFESACMVTTSISMITNVFPHERRETSYASGPYTLTSG